MLLFKQDGTAEINGEPAPSLSIFTRGLGEQKWRHRGLLEAKPVSKDFQVEGDSAIYKAGNYLVKNEYGEYFAMTKDEFEQNYELVVQE